jgi:opacity protein-like surface antigen
MKTTKCWSRMGLLALLAILAAVPNRGAASSLYPEGLYGWYEVGPTIIEDAELKSFFGNPTDDNAVEFNPGFHFGIAFGQEVTRHLRLEFETGYNFNSLDGISGAVSSTADLHRVPLFANIVWQLPNDTGFVPMVGVGIGGQWLHLEAKEVTFGLTTLDDSNDTWAFGYQGYAGVLYELNERFSLGLFYHYSVADAPSWKFDTAPGGTFKLDGLRAHSLSLTVGWIY